LISCSRPWPAGDSSTAAAFHPAQGPRQRLAAACDYRRLEEGVTPMRDLFTFNDDALPPADLVLHDF
jgi:hypothetical protein